ncbi:peptidoglycan-binding protein [Pararhodobacter sp.]|uniref:peptidoglycan-binding protein n=1 Tax=Pararhodobacter sp. TaxID=2127056 RepID=UPI002FE25E2A
MKFRLTAAMLLTAVALPAMADTGAVLIVANEDYQSIRDARGARAMVQAEGVLQQAGFDVDIATDVSANALRAALSGLSETLRTGEDERVVFVYAGYTVSADHGIWLMGTEARSPDFASVESYGVRLETVLALAGQRQGGAIVALADFGFPENASTGFRGGLPPQITVPQGVTLVRGPAAGIAVFLRDIARPGVNVAEAVARRSDLRIEGFTPPYLTFLPEGHQPPTQIDRNAEDRLAWQVAANADTLAAYESYLANWPNGIFAEQARNARQRLMNTPERIEQALNLTRDERRAIQRDLTILGFDPRGIDGIFGAGTRAAVGAWQGANRLTQTGFLNRDQIFELAQQGARRAAQLEEEARARAAEQERADRQFWRDTGAGQDEAGMRAYLQRFPDGIFSTVAQQRLDQIEADRRAAAQARDRAAWDQAAQTDTIAAYDGYIRAFPQGAFVDQARTRIQQLSRPPEPEVDEGAARAEEDLMQLPQFTRVIIEQRLAMLGLEPGTPDGTFDRDTRRAIRRYQRRADLPVTGYLTQPIVARLLTEGFLNILR